MKWWQFWKRLRRCQICNEEYEGDTQIYLVSSEGTHRLNICNLCWATLEGQRRQSLQNKLNVKLHDPFRDDEEI